MRSCGITEDAIRPQHAGWHGNIAKETAWACTRSHSVCKGMRAFANADCRAPSGRPNMGLSPYP